MKVEVLAEIILGKGMAMPPSMRTYVDLVCPEKGVRYHMEWKVSGFLQSTEEHFMNGGTTSALLQCLHCCHVCVAATSPVSSHITGTHTGTHSHTDSFEFWCVWKRGQEPSLSQLMR